MDNKGHDSGLYGALLSHYLHQDGLLWSRVQFLVVIQSAVLAGSYTLRGQWLAYAVLAIGFWITLLLFFLVEKDQRDRDVNLRILDMLGWRLLPTELRPIRIRMTTQWIIRGRYILRTVLWFFLILDLVVGTLYRFFPNLFPQVTERAVTGRLPCAI